MVSFGYRILRCLKKLRVDGMEVLRKEMSLFHCGYSGCIASNRVQMVAFMLCHSIPVAYHGITYG